MLEIPWPPFTGNHQYFANKMLKPEIKQYRARVSQIINPLGLIKPISSPIHVEYVLAPPEYMKNGRRNNNRFDFGNVIKVVDDAITLAGIWADDSNKHIVSGSWKWAIPESDGGLLITISEAI